MKYLAWSFHVLPFFSIYSEYTHELFVKAICWTRVPETFFTSGENQNWYIRLPLKTDFLSGITDHFRNFVQHLIRHFQDFIIITLFSHSCVYLFSDNYVSSKQYFPLEAELGGV